MAIAFPKRQQQQQQQQQQKQTNDTSGNGDNVSSSLGGQSFMTSTAWTRSNKKKKPTNKRNPWIWFILIYAPILLIQIIYFHKKLLPAFSTLSSSYDDERQSMALAKQLKEWSPNNADYFNIGDIDDDDTTFVGTGANGKSIINNNNVIDKQRRQRERQQQKEKQREKNHNKRRQAVGTLNGYHIYYYNEEEEGKTTRDQAASAAADDDDSTEKLQSRKLLETDINLSNGYEKNTTKFTYQKQHHHHHHHHTVPSPSVYSNMHCVGETYEKPFFFRRVKEYLDFSWRSRSCHFEFFCFNLTSRQFQIHLPSKENDEVHKHHEEHTFQNNWDITQTYFYNKTLRQQWEYDYNPKNPRMLHKIIDENLYYPYGISIGGINQKWTIQPTGIPRLFWFPHIVYGPAPKSFYTLDSNVVLVPYHALAPMNPGHLLWDDWLPIFTLLHMFQLLPEQQETFYQPGSDYENENDGNDGNDDNDNEESISRQQQQPEIFLMRYRFSEDPLDGLWADCDWKGVNTATCIKMLKKFAPLIVSNPDAIPLTSQYDYNLTLWENHPNQGTTKEDTAKKGTSSSNRKQQQPASDLVCSKNGLAGLGPLTDHGAWKGHGWEQVDYTTTHNHGRGSLFWKFRNFMMTNLGLLPQQQLNQNRREQKHTDKDNSEQMFIDEKAPPGTNPLRIFFSENSSAKRPVTFNKQIKALEELYRGDPTVSVERYIFSKFSLRKQAEMTSSCGIFITGGGGGAMTASFLPRGASLLIYYREEGGVENNKKTGLPALLDWDFFNHMSYVRVHWMGTATRNTQNDMNGFIALIQRQVDIIRRQRIEYDLEQQMNTNNE